MRIEMLFIDFKQAFNKIKRNFVTKSFYQEYQVEDLHHRFEK